MKRLYVLLFLLILAVPASAAFQQEPDGTVIICASSYVSNVVRGGAEWVPVASPIATCPGAIQSQPSTALTRSSSELENSAYVRYEIDFQVAGQYRVWLFAKGLGGASDSVHVGLNGVGQPRSVDMDGFPNSYTWTNSQRIADGSLAPGAEIDVQTIGVNTLEIFHRQKNASVAKIIITPNPGYVPQGEGPEESDDSASPPPPPPAERYAIKYQRATTYEDGSVLPLDEILRTSLHCDGPNITYSHDGAPGQFEPDDWEPGETRDCFATHTATNGLDSQPSETVSLTWPEGEQPPEPQRPDSPTLELEFIPIPETN